MTAPLVRHGWTIALHPQLFSRQYAELKAEVKRLKQELNPQSFVQHPRVKLLAAVVEGIKERIAADPYASRFALTGPLRRYGRLKGLGLPDRYRLFFRPFEAEDRRLLLILWLGFPRKDGDRNDCYAVFSRLVQRGECRRTGRACGVSSTPAEGPTRAFSKAVKRTPSPFQSSKRGFPRLPVMSHRFPPTKDGSAGANTPKTAYTWTERHSDDVLKKRNKDILPAIGGIAIDAITAHDCLAVLQVVDQAETRRGPTASHAVKVLVTN